MELKRDWYIYIRLSKCTSFIGRLERDIALSIFCMRTVFMRKHSFNCSDIPLWGMESVYRNGQLVGCLRRAERGYTFRNNIGQA